MVAREEVLVVIREIIDKKRSMPESEQTDALSILLSQVDAGEGISQKEVEDSVIEGMFSAQNGKILSR